jgi:L-threonylcarbamoyladenylate synthase
MIISLRTEYDAALAAAVDAVKSGQLFIYPTDTLYGIGCDATNEKAVEKIYALKGREARKPLSVIVANLQMLKEYCHVDGNQLHVLTRLLPGPYTFLLKSKKKIPACNEEKIGIRMPENYFALAVCKNAGVPVVSTSANVSGKEDAAEIGEVDAKIAKSGAIPLAIDGGRCKYAQASTVIDLVDMKVLRKGAVRDGDKFEDID